MADGHKEGDKNFTGSIPDVYDEYLVPLIFEPYAADMARRVGEMAPGSVLETAAGSGVVTRAMARGMPAGVRYVASDLNQPMLDRAKSQQPDPERIDWQQADALSLPFENNSFDVVCCQFGVMFFPDLVAGFKEARRVLKPGGCFVFNVWDGIEENDFARSVTETACRHFPDDPPLFLARTPHGFGDKDDLAFGLIQAGFTDIDAYTVTEESRGDSPFDPAYAYCHGTPLRNELEARDPNCLAPVTKAAAEDIRTAFGDGPVSGRIQGHVFTARM